ncbi:hypothetical protein ACIG47_14195 [Promicromonospora sp. NPDC052451]|uniref:hypothetical protein n=1 Tax=Promicromonospora sp. NPDC052451 TaxID=3364407 RepID=UPI0037C944E2
MSKRRTPSLAAVLAVPLLLVALSACGTAGDAPDAESTADSGTEQFESLEDYQLAFASCMRDQGVDMADPNSDGSVEAQAGDAFMEAAEVCQGELGRPPAAPGGGPSMSDEEQRAEWLEIAACLRDNGIDVADPGPGESLTIPMDVPDDVFAECAPQGVGGSTGLGS